MKECMKYIFAAFFFVIPVFHGNAQAIEPSEPDIVLPSVILEIEDLSVESVVAKLPEEEEILPPDNEFPLPEPEDLVIEEPMMDFNLPGAGITSFPGIIGNNITAEAVLGTGTLNHFYSSISIYKLGKEPEGKILFKHEVLDGFSQKPPGAGYNMKEDAIESSLRQNIGEVGFRAEGSFLDFERGLQGNGDFYSKINRFVGGVAEAEYQLSDRIRLKGSIDTNLATQLLTRSNPQETEQEKITEFTIATLVNGEFNFEKGIVGINPRFSYRSVDEKSELSLARAEIKGLVGIDLSNTLRFNGNISWFFSENTNSLFPFDLTLLAQPNDFFNFKTSVGYKIHEYDLKDIFSDFPLIGIPDKLKDNYGWFIDLRSNWNLYEGWIISGGMALSDNSAMPGPIKTVDPITGLFLFNQEEALRFNADIGVRWILSKNLSIGFRWDAELLKRPGFSPEHRITAEASGTEKSGKFGGDLSFDFLTGVNDFVQAPVCDISGFYQIAKFIRLEGELNDILYPSLKSPRYGWYPYLEPGFMFTLRANITF